MFSFPPTTTTITTLKLTTLSYLAASDAIEGAGIARIMPETAQNTPKRPPSRASRAAMALPAEALVVATLRPILRDGDWQTLTLNTVMEALVAQLGADVAPARDMVNREITKFIQVTPKSSPRPQ